MSMDMYSMHDVLREDRHDKPVHMIGEEIRKKIQKIIDDAKEGDGDGDGDGDGKGNKNSKDATLKYKVVKGRGLAGLKDSKPSDQLIEEKVYKPVPFVKEKRFVEGVLS